ncbi:MAG TPA: glyoxalase/bleomycin resistance/extradiol dioxygenase family protein, partial [Methanobacteriaceae archaeon]|nr:glyoxalase/bleomycin resistance/extradiol dioxygenase family protein [Methanobacteriaceae archaeon]
VRPYLSFHGECQEAIELYMKAFNIEKSDIMRFGDMPESPENAMQISDEQKDWILQATLPFGDNFIRLSDSPLEINDDPTDRIGIVVESSVEIVETAFNVLKEEGRAIMPLQQTFFSPSYGIVIDKFGVMWNLAAMEGE